MANNRKRKNRSKKQKSKPKQNKKKSNLGSEFFQIFLELNNAFLPSPKTGQINLKNYLQKDSYCKLKVIPTKFLKFWEWSQESDSITDQQISLKFLEFMDELRPHSVDGFESEIMLDDHQFKVNGKIFFNFNNFKRNFENF